MVVYHLANLATLLELQNVVQDSASCFQLLQLEWFQFVGKISTDYNSKFWQIN